LQLDFAGGKVEAKDIFIEITDLPVVGNIKIGHFKEPFSLEELTSSKYITFMERPAVTAFNPSRNTGIMLHNHVFKERLSWQIGWFRNTDSYGNNKDAANNQNLTFRLAGLPLYKEKEHRFLHLGMGYSHRTGLKEYSISARPEAHMAGKYVSTGTIGDIERENLINGELAFVSGSFALQGELFQSSVNTHLSGPFDFNGNYVRISYLLTGENKSYKSPGEGFGRINPKNNFNGKDNGIGAWEVALRSSSIDLRDAEGRQMNLFTAGVNWYLNPSVRIMTNFGLVDLHNIGRMNVLQMRFQIDF
jgi:phosphate-selective porin OprO/OprP